MAKVTGTVTLVNANGSPIAHQQDATLNFNKDLPDATDKDDGGWADHITGGVRDWAIDVSGLIDYTSSFGNDELRTLITSDDQTAAVEFGSGVSGTLKLTGTVSLSNISEAHPQYAPGTYSGTLVGKGSPTIATY